MSEHDEIISLENNGYCILKNIFNSTELENYRKNIFNHLDLFPNTRPSPNSRHLAGFHRYTELVTIHSEILSNNKIKKVFSLIPGTGNGKWISIGLTDITINRSQQWHTDLLRGKYKSYINNDNFESINEGGVYKILLYLQEGKNLKVVPKSHKIFSPLNDNSSERFASKNDVKTLEIGQGDVIIMDIRLQHKGASEDEMMKKELNDNGKILISTVIGESSKKLTHQMMLGNSYRQIDWDEKYLSHFFKIVEINTKSGMKTL